MAIYLKFFETVNQYNTYTADTANFILPNVSLIEETNGMAYHPYVEPPYSGFCKLYLSNGSTVEIQGSGELTYSQMEQYLWESVDAVEIGTQCTAIGNSVFTNGSDYVRMSSVTISNTVTSIGDSAFSDCSNLTSINIPDSVTSIGNGAFYSCTSLTSCTIGNGVTEIGKYAFSDCSNLTSIDIPDSVISIGDSAFYETPWWGTYSADTSHHYGNIIYINDIAYKATSTSITSATFRSGTTSIGGSAFENCRSLTSIDIPDSVTSIGGSAFESCSNLTSIDIPDSVTSIGNYVFYQCSGLTSCTIGNGVTSIGDYVFYSCRSLSSIDIPDSVTSIGNYVFYQCSGLTSIVSNATTAPTISNATFRDIKTSGTLTVPQGSSGYDVWMGTGNYYLGKYGWTKVEQ